MLSTTALYAVRAVSALAHLDDSEYAGAGSIAAGTGAPPNYLSKLLQTLTRHDVVRSRKGMGGGFRLARPAEEISLFEVVEPIDHVSRWNGCFLGNNTCGTDGECRVHRRWSPVRDAYLAMLRDSTVEEIARDGVALDTIFPHVTAGGEQ